jgi:hypothetical protein
MAWNSGNSAPSPWQFGSFSWRGEIVFVAGQGAVSEEPGNEGVHAGGDVGAAAGPAVEAGGAGGEFVVGDPASVADEIGQGHGEFLVVDVFDVAAAGVRRRADSGGGRAGKG